MNTVEICDKGIKTIYAITKVGDDFYFSDADNKGLMKYNPTSKKLDVLDIFDSKDIFANYAMAFSIEDRIWFIPSRLYEKIAIYDIKLNKLSYLKIPDSEKKCSYSPFEYYYFYDGSVYLTPKFYDCLLRIDLCSLQMERIDIGVSENAGKGSSISLNSLIHDGIIYCCPYNHNTIISYDIKAQKTVSIVTDIKPTDYAIVTVVGGEIYFLPKQDKNPVLVCSRDLQLIRKEEIHYDVSNYRTQFATAINRNGRLLLFPYCGNEILILDAYSLETIDKIMLNSTDSKEAIYYFGRIMEYGDSYIICPDEKNTPLLYGDDEKMKQLSIIYPDDYFIELLLKEIEKKEEKE